MVQAANWQEERQGSTGRRPLVGALRGVASLSVLQRNSAPHSEETITSSGRAGKTPAATPLVGKNRGGGEEGG